MGIACKELLSVREWRCGGRCARLLQIMTEIDPDCIES